MDELFNPERLKIARLRRKMSYKTLAELSGLFQLNQSVLYLSFLQEAVKAEATDH